MEEMIYRPIQPGEWAQACSFVTGVFEHDVAPHYDEEGVRAFLAFVQPQAMAARLEAGGRVFLAVQEDQIVGLAEVRDGSHIALLFVSPLLQRRGIGWELLRHAVAECRRGDPHLRAVTVNASPNARRAYERFGFVYMAKEQVKNGIRYFPMRLVLK